MSASPRVHSVGIVGAGRVGPVLGAALADAGYGIVGIATRPVAVPSRKTVPPRGTVPSRVTALLPAVPVRPAEELAAEADLVILAVPDDELTPLAARLAGSLRPHQRERPQVVAHTSGAHGIGVLAPVSARGARPLALHPAMTFTGRPDDLVRLRKGIPFGVTAPPDVRPLAHTLVRELNGTPEWVDEHRRPLYHAALAHGANHLVTLVADALDLLRAAGVADPARMLDPLLHAALDNALRLGDAALTGPVSRGDAGTVSRHLDVVGMAVPGSRAGYAALARRTADRAAATGRLTRRQARGLAAVLDGGTTPARYGEEPRSFSAVPATPADTGHMVPGTIGDVRGSSGSPAPVTDRGEKR